MNSGGEFAVRSERCSHIYFLTAGKGELSVEGLPFMTCRTQDDEFAIHHKNTLLGDGSDHPKWCDLKARIKPETGIAVIRGNQQVFEYRRPGDAFCITVTRESGHGTLLYCCSESGEENELVFRSGVARRENLVCLSRGKPCRPEREINRSELLRNKIVDGFKLSLVCLDRSG